MREQRWRGGSVCVCLCGEGRGAGEEVGWAGTRVCVCGHVNLAET